MKTLFILIFLLPLGLQAAPVCSRIFQLHDISLAAQESTFNALAKMKIEWDLAKGQGTSQDMTIGILKDAYAHKFSEAQTILNLTSSQLEKVIRSYVEKNQKILTKQSLQAQEAIPPKSLYLPPIYKQEKSVNVTRFQYPLNAQDVQILAQSSDGQRVLLQWKDHPVELWDVTNENFVGFAKRAHAFVRDSDKGFLYMIDADKNFIKVDLDSFDIVNKVSLGDKIQRAEGVDISPSGNLIAVRDSSRVYIFNALTGKEESSFPVPYTKRNLVRFIDEVSVAFSSNSHLKKYDLQQIKNVQSVHVEDTNIQDIGITSDRKVLNIFNGFSVKAVDMNTFEMKSAHPVLAEFVGHGSIEQIPNDAVGSFLVYGRKDPKAPGRGLRIFSHHDLENFVFDFDAQYNKSHIFEVIFSKNRERVSVYHEKDGEYFIDSWQIRIP